MSDLVIPNTLTPGTPEDVSDVQDNFTAVSTWANGNIDGDNFTAATNQALGLSETGTVRRGKAIIATEEARTNTAYGTLTTPDRVSNVVLPADAWIVIGYQALWKESVTNTARAAIFIGSNQLTIQAAAFGPAGQAAMTGAAGANIYRLLGTFQGGLASHAHGTAQTSDVTTGQVLGQFIQSGANLFYEVGGASESQATDLAVGGTVVIFAAAGTYTVSVQFKSSSGTVTVKERKLWVRTEAFG